MLFEPEAYHQPADMKKYILACCLIPAFYLLPAQTKTWNGANGANWNVAGNWLPVGVPAASDTVVFNSFNACNVDINPSIAALRVLGSGGNLLSAAGLRTITINNNAAANPVLSVASGSSLSIGNGGFGVSIQTYGGATPNYARIDGSMSFGFASSWILCNGGLTALTNADIYGTITFASVHTGLAFTNSTASTLLFLNGSTLNWARNGGLIPTANYQNGSTINVTGISNTMVTFNNSSTYNGLIIWNAAAQTASGAAAVLLPLTSANMDSIRVVSTGTGTLRLSTNPAGFVIGHLEVQGGTLEISAPAASVSGGTISTDLKMTGGTIIGNATYAGDVGAAYPMLLAVNGNFTMTGSSTFNLSNRPMGNAPAGALQVSVSGNLSQTSGTITTTSAFGSQHYISMGGPVTRTIQMSNITGSVGLVVNKIGGTLILQAPLTLPYALNLVNGVFTTTNTNLLTMAAGSVVASASNNSFVNGPIRKTGNTAFTFPVGKTNCGPSGAVNGYAALSVSNFTNGAATDQFTAEYIRGDAMTLGTISNAGLDHISRCDYWTLTRDNGISTVDIALSWSESINNCITTAPYVNNLPSLTIAHNNNAGGTWDVIGVAGVTTGNATAGSVVWSGTQSATFGAFAIGSTNFQNPLPFTINYFNGLKQNGNHLLTWKLTCYSTPSVRMTLERSSNAGDYVPVHSVDATALQCQQPFSYSDMNPATGMNYYRLKITDADGKVTYSSMVSLINAARGIDIMNITPNPVVGGTFKLKVSAAQKTNMEVMITDMQGRLMQKQAVNAVAGFNVMPVDVRGLAAGTYQLAGYSSEGRTRILRFVIQ